MTLKLRDFFSRLTPVVLTQTTGLACGVASVKLASRYVPPDVLGNYGVFMSFTTLGMWVVHAGLIKYVGRHWAASEAKADLLRQMVRLWFRKLPWIIIGSLGAAVGIAQLTGHATWGLLPSLIIISGVLSLVAMGQTALQVNRQHWTDFGISAIGSLTRTFLPLGLFIMLGSATGLYAGLTLHILVGIAAVAWVMRPYWHATAPSGTAMVRINELYTGQYFTVLALAGWVLAGANRWVVAGYFGSVEAGYFTLASNMALIVPTFIGSVTSQLFQPGFFAMGDQLTSANRHGLSRRIDAVAAGFCALSMIGVWALHLVLPWLIGPLIDQKYSAALPWVVPVGFFGIAVTVGQYYHTLLLAARREKSCAPVDLTGAVLLVGGSALAALGGKELLAHWLLCTPLIPWLVQRSQARYYYSKAD